jgi:hypothetical protein
MASSAAMHPTLPEGSENRSLEPRSLNIPVGTAGIPKMLSISIPVAGEIRPPQWGGYGEWPPAGRPAARAQPLPWKALGKRILGFPKG